MFNRYDTNRTGSLSEQQLVCALEQFDARAQPSSESQPIQTQAESSSYAAGPAVQVRVRVKALGLDQLCRLGLGLRR